ncbi:MAG: ABC transporter permease [bacterium]|nr:ABC transporter permease [bacterium]MDE0287989.1 ABC transporter permease [bacterium]MDE0438074.1 ABC transporter permease [bacterium]
MRRLAARVETIAWARLGLFFGVFAVFAIADPRFAGPNNVFTIFEGFAWLGLAALAVGLTIIAGELDLSVGSVAAVAGIVAVSIVEDIGLVAAVVVTALLGMAYGAVQGYLIHRLKIHSLVFTLGTLIGLRGLAFMISGENTVVMKDLDIADVVRHQLWIFSPFSLVTIVVFTLVGLFLVYTRYGREIFAVGGGRQEAAAAGVPLVRPLVLTFALSGSMAALAGALTSIKSGSAGPAAFEQLLLPAATAALIGGVSLLGGKGSVIGVAVGTLTLRFITSGLSLGGAPFYVLTLATGAVLIVVVVLELVVERPVVRAALRRRRARRRARPGAQAG